MQYQVQFGKLDSASPIPASTDRFRIAILGDFSGRGNRRAVETGAELGRRRPLKVNSENLDELIEQLEIRLQLPAGPEGAILEVPVRCLEDFHPDQLYESVPLFERLANLRARLQDATTFEKAAAALRSLALPGGNSATKHAQTSASVSIPRKRLDSLGDLLQKDTFSQNQPSDLKSLLKNVVGPHIVPATEGQDQLLAALDDALSGLMCTILHHPDFQAIESLWRSIDLLVHRLELDHELEIVLFDISAEELATDLASVDNLEESGVFQLLVEHPSQDANQGSFSLVIGNYVFESIPPHAELLARIAQIAAHSNTAFVASMQKACIDVTPADEVHPLVAEAWAALKSLPQASHIALTSPRFMLRWPYGKKTEPIETFEFEEFNAASGLRSMLWGNSAILAGLLIGLTYRTTGLQAMKLGSILTIDDMPFYYYTDQYGDQVALPCTERLIGERLVKNLNAQNLVPVLSMKGANEVRLGGFTSLAGKPLAGPWLEKSETASNMATQATDVAPPPGAPPTETPPADAADLGELDDLLADLEAPSTPPPAADQNVEQSSEGVADEESLDDLDSLLADLDSQDETKAAESEGDELDSELADLLADL